MLNVLDVTVSCGFCFLQCSRTLKQLHYFNWPDHGVPDSIPPILDMLKEMRTYQSHDDIPICIHCRSAFQILLENILIHL